MPVRINNKSLHLRDLTPKIEKTFRKVCVRMLDEVAEEAVIEARTNHGYTDQTGNLTSSIGAVVVDGAFVAHQKPVQVRKGSDGVSKARKILDEVVQERSDDMELHIVAGMEYALAVENGGEKNRTPRVVLSGAKLLAEQRIEEELHAMGIKFIRK